MRKLKMIAVAIPLSVMSFVDYGSSIGISNDMQISGVETSDMVGIESRNTTTPTITTLTTTTTGTIKPVEQL